MSGQGEYQNYSEINLNAIKNTKLFQKFMQNKSGLIPSGSSSVLTNPKAQNQQSPVQEAQVVRQKKWAKNRNVNKVTKFPQVVEQNRDEKQILTQKQDNIVIPSTNKLEPQVNHLQKPIESNETVRIRGLEKQQQTIVTNNKDISENQRNQMQLSYGQRVLQNQVQMTQNNNPPPVQNRRKRNFNPNFESSRSHQQTFQQKTKSQFQSSKNEGNSNQLQQKHVSYVSSFGIKNIPEPFTQKNINIYNSATVRQQTFTHQDQKHPKPQFSPTQNPYPHTYTFNQPPQSTSQLTTPSLANCTQSQYKQKYESLLKKYQQLKHQIKNENKNRKKQLTQWQHEIDMVKQKLFDVQSRQDTLLIQNQRLKQKWQSQNLFKMKIQEENKQLGYKIKQLQDQLTMRDNHMKQRSDQTNYWKSQADGLKQELHGLRLNFEKRNDQYNLLLGDCQIVKRERDNKDYLLEDLRKNIAFLVEENSAAKDEIFKLVTKLYQLQQENQMLRNDIKRQSLDHSQLNNYMKDLQQQSRDRIVSSNIQRQRHHQRQHYEYKNQYQMQKNQSLVLKQTIPRNSFPDQEKQTAAKQTRIRGEFARERGQLARNQRGERDQRPLPTSQTAHNIQNVNIPQQRQQIVHKNPQFANNNKVARMTEIAQELERIKDMKAMNGAIRRKKIQLERELQELESQ